VTYKEEIREGRRLEFSARVGVDFAIQANFFKSWCCPLHDIPQYQGIFCLDMI